MVHPNLLHSYVNIRVLRAHIRLRGLAGRPFTLAKTVLEAVIKNL